MAYSDCAQVSPPNVVLYTRRGCHLCDVARQVLERHGIFPACVDIDEDPQLREKFDTCVPVVEIGGRIRFRGAVHPLLLRRIIRNEIIERK
jgi:glutaredoxin